MATTTKTVHRSSVSGRFVPAQYVQTHKSTTETERVRVPAPSPQPRKK